MKDYRYYAYIVANTARLLYVGFTNDIEDRVWKHKNKTLECSTNKWKVCRLVHFEKYQDVNEALAREKQLKRWTRSKKIALIEATNPNWKDLAEDWGKPLDQGAPVPKTISAQERQSRIKDRMKAAKAGR
jgi:putative endonuclease